MAFITDCSSLAASVDSLSCNSFKYSSNSSTSLSSDWGGGLSCKLFFAFTRFSKASSSSKSISKPFKQNALHLSERRQKPRLSI